jgi:hypothetical protein
LKPHDWYFPRFYSISVTFFDVVENGDLYFVARIAAEKLIYGGTPSGTY